MLRHEKLAKSLKTGFSCLSIREMTPEIRESQYNYTDCSNTIIIGITINSIN